MKIRAEKRKGECTQINDVETNVFVHDETKKPKLVKSRFSKVGSRMKRRETKEKTID
jgi:hypothetical protein